MFDCHFCLSLAFQMFQFYIFVHFTALLKTATSESRSTDSHLFYLCWELLFYLCWQPSRNCEAVYFIYAESRLGAEKPYRSWSCPFSFKGVQLPLFQAFGTLLGSLNCFGDVCHVFHLEMSAFALAFQDVSIEDVCICISFSFASLSISLHCWKPLGVKAVQLTAIYFIYAESRYFIYADSRLGTESCLGAERCLGTVKPF